MQEKHANISQNHATTMIRNNARQLLVEGKMFRPTKIKHQCDPSCQVMNWGAQRED